MKILPVSADDFMSFTRWLRETKGTLIRAKPFTKAENTECYLCMYIGEKHG